MQSVNTHIINIAHVYIANPHREKMTSKKIDNSYYHVASSLIRAAALPKTIE